MYSLQGITVPIPFLRHLPQYLTCLLSFWNFCFPILFFHLPTLKTFYTVSPIPTLNLHWIIPLKIYTNHNHWNSDKKLKINLFAFSVLLEHQTDPFCYSEWLSCAEIWREKKLILKLMTQSQEENKYKVDNLEKNC